MEKREKEISDRLEEARLTLEDAQKKLSEYQHKQDQFAENEKSMMVKARQESEEYRKNLLKEARYDIEKMQDRWKKTIDNEKEQFLTELEEHSFERVLEAVRKIIRELSSEELEHHVLTTFIQKIETIPPEQVEIFVSSPDHLLDITTAFGVSEQEKLKIEAKLKEVFSNDIQCVFEEDPELGMGIEIRTSGWKMGWNLRAYLEEMREEMASLLEYSVKEATEENIV